MKEAQSDKRNNTVGKTSTSVGRPRYQQKSFNLIKETRTNPTEVTTTPTVLAVHDTINLARPRFQGTINVKSHTPKMEPIVPNQQLQDNFTLPQENRNNG